MKWQKAAVAAIVLEVFCSGAPAAEHRTTGKGQDLPTYSATWSDDKAEFRACTESCVS